MKKSLLACAALIVSTVMASAAFVPPTQAKIDAAANAPAKVAALLTDATAAEAQTVFKSVLTAVKALGLPPADLQTRAEAVLVAVATYVRGIVGLTPVRTEAAIAKLFTITATVLGESVGPAVIEAAQIPAALLPPGILAPYIQ